MQSILLSYTEFGFAEFPAVRTSICLFLSIFLFHSLYLMFHRLLTSDFGIGDFFTNTTLLLDISTWCHLFCIWFFGQLSIHASTVYIYTCVCVCVYMHLIYISFFLFLKKRTSMWLYHGSPPFRGPDSRRLFSF